MMKLLTNPWMNLPVGALIYLGATLLFWKTPVPPPVATEGYKPAFTGPSWDYINPEAEQLMTELKSLKTDLQSRKQQLDEYAVSLQSRSNEIVAANQTLRRLQDDFDKSVVRVQDEEVNNLKKLAKVYGVMAPDSAASVMADLDDAVIVKIMLNMKESEVAAILEVFAKKGPAEAKRAAAISEHVRLSIGHKPGTK